MWLTCCTGGILLGCVSWPYRETVASHALAEVGNVYTWRTPQVGRNWCRRLICNTCGMLCDTSSSSSMDFPSWVEPDTWLLLIHYRADCSVRASN